MTGKGTDYLIEKRLRKFDPDLHRRFKDAVFVCQRILSNFRQLFPEYTDHSELHSLTVIDSCNRLIGTEQIDKLNKNELFVLLMAGYLHDIGMGIGEKDYEEFKDVLGAEQYFKDHPNDSKADFVRTYHNEFSGLFIDKYAPLFDLPSDEYLVLHDLMIADEQGSTTQIDHVVVSRFGLFIIETKCYKGWIFGNEKNRFWSQTLYAGGRGWFARSKKYRFQNPIRQNWRHIYVLSERLKIPRRHFFNVVVFSGDAIFKTPMPDNVMHENHLVPYIRSFTDERLTKPRALQIFESIRRVCIEPTAEQKSAHVYMLNVNHATEPAVSNTQAVPHCPRCGAAMRLRHRHSDNAPFYGCSNYPKCRGIGNISPSA